jgi:hypothetical protein
VICWLALSLVASSQVPGPAVGEIRTLRVDPDSWAPLARDIDAYTSLLEAARTRDSRTIDSLWSAKGVWFVADTRRMEVVSIRQPEKSWKLAIPAVEVKPADGKSLPGGGRPGETRWIPIPYLREDNEADPRAEPGMPRIKFTVDRKAMPEPGKLMTLFGNVDEVPVCKDVFAFESFIKSLRARDGDGLDELRRRGVVKDVPLGTDILVIERHTNPFLAKGTHAVEGRVQGGPMDGKVVWVQEEYTGVIKILVGPPAKRRR